SVSDSRRRVANDLFNRLTHKNADRFERLEVTHNGLLYQPESAATLGVERSIIHKQRRAPIRHLITFEMPSASASNKSACRLKALK
ncbi:hypothetical protein, partial [Burkholderia ubonensis]|uniref:hypothetical protein n=1 Tax=Burkholderia ubonensis TaxID=101571 RepID=UPI001E39A985